MRNHKQSVQILAFALAVLMLLSLILGLIPNAEAASSSEIKQQINALQSQKADIRGQMEDLKNQYAETEDEIANLLAKKSILDQEVFLLNSEIENINSQIGAYNVLIADKQAELEEAEADWEILNEKHKDRIRTMEEEGELSYWSVIFKAKSFADLLDRLNMIQEIASADRRRLEQLRDAAKVVEEARLSLEEEKAALQRTKDELDASYEEMYGKRQESTDLIQTLLQKAKEIEGLQAELEQEDNDLLNQIAQMEKEYNDAKYQEWLAHMATATTAPPVTTAPPETTAPPATQPPAQEGEATQPADQPTEPTAQPTQPPTQPPTEPPTEPTQPKPEGWIRPCGYVMISSPFGDRDAPTAGASTNHKGVDLAGAEGTPIVASRSGTVTIATYSNSAGYYVTINHGDGFSSVYMHMTGFAVSVGQYVSQGQVIGYMGSTGISTGPHLHFGITYNGVYVNPASYVPL